MILTCPECATQYFAEDATIGETGRNVKCAACGHSWYVGPAGEVNRAATLAGAHEEYRLKVRERKRQKSRAVALTAWMVTAALFAAAVGGFVLFRDRVVKIWPQAASTYAALGMPVNRFGLDFREAGAERFFDGTIPILEVRGQVENVVTTPVEAPRVRVLLLDEQGAAVATAYAPVTPTSIQAGTTGVFAARIENPPFESFELELSFVPAETSLAETGPAIP